MAALPVPSVPGAWTWHQDPRIRHIPETNETLFGLNDEYGNVKVTSFNHATNEVRTNVLEPRILIDDHICPVLFRRNDDRLICLYARAAVTGDDVWYKVSDEPLDISSWGPRRTITHPESNGISYPNTHYNPTSDRTFMLYRTSGLGRRQMLITSDDNGLTWNDGDESTESDYPKRFTQLFGESIRDYIKIYDDPSGEGHHLSIHRGNHGSSMDTFEGDWKYDWWAYVYWDHANNEIRTADGTVLATEDTLPLENADMDGHWVTLASEVASNRMRVFDLDLGADGNPRVLYTDITDLQDHDYYYARWDGSQWHTNHICAAGHGLNADDFRAYYSGGLCFHPTNKDIVVTSREINGTHEIFEAEMSDQNGTSWTLTPITENSENMNWRPARIWDATAELPYVWHHGEFTEYTDYTSTVHSTLEREIPDPSEVPPGAARIPANGSVRGLRLMTSDGVVKGGRVTTPSPTQ